MDYQETESVQPLLLFHANLAQVAERHPRNVQVVGSTPIVGSG